MKQQSPTDQQPGLAKWWRWRESNPRPKIFHVKRLHA